MTVTEPRLPPSVTAPEIDAGVIEDARARQRRQRRAGGAVMLAAVIAAALIGGMFGGGGGGGGRGGGGSTSARQPAGSAPGAGPAHAAANTSFPAAPATQRNGYGVASDACPLAAPNRYLPARSGCVTVRRADINGDGRPDLVIVYSRLGKQMPPGFPGEPARFRHQFGARAAFLKVVLAGGGSVTTRITGVDGAKAAAVDAIAHVSDEPGDEIFLEVGRISSGATGVAYGFRDGRLLPAGISLSYNGDSGVQAGFDCLPGNPPRLIQRYFTFIGPNEFTRSWRETELTYVWHGPKLVRLSRHTVGQLVAVNSSETHIGSGCLHGVS